MSAQISAQMELSYTTAWTDEFLIDAHDSLLMRAAPEMVNIVHNGRQGLKDRGTLLIPDPACTL